MSEQPLGPGQQAPATPQQIQWNRVIRYTGVLFAVTFVIGCAGGFVRGVNGGGDFQGSWIILWSQAVLMVVATAAVFAWIGRIQVTLTWGHAALTWVLANVLAFVLNVLLMGQPIDTFMCSTVAFTLVAAIGTALGAVTRRSSASGLGRGTAHDPSPEKR